MKTILAVSLLVLCSTACLDEETPECRTNADCPNIQFCDKGTCASPEGFSPEDLDSGSTQDSGSTEDSGTDDTATEDTP